MQLEAPSPSPVQAARGLFRVLQLDFGDGSAWFQRLAAWHDDPWRCRRLVVVAIDRDLAHHAKRLAHWQAMAQGSDWLAEVAQRLIDAWPPSVANLHGLRLQGPDQCVAVLLRYPSSAPHPWRNLVGEFDEIVPTAEPSGMDTKARDRLMAHEAPRPAWRASPQAALNTGRQAPRPRDGLAFLGPARSVKTAIVVGGGLAGACMVHALRQRGVSCVLLEQAVEPASQASGAAAGVFHGTVHREDSLHSRLLRAGALFSHACFQPAIQAGVPGDLGGVLRLTDVPAFELEEIVRRQSLPSSWVQVRPEGGWFFPRAGWISPRDWIAWVLSPHSASPGGPSVRVLTEAHVASLERVQQAGHDGWVARANDGAAWAKADAVVLANADDARRLAPWARWAWSLSRGQSSMAQASVLGIQPLAQPVVGAGYALSLPPDQVVYGASHHLGDLDPHPRASDSQDNWGKLARLTGINLDGRRALDANIEHRVGWRVVTGDRLPLAGAVPSRLACHTHQDHARKIAREPGLYVLTALGSRGLSLAPLLADGVACAMLREPLPLEAPLWRAVDPARFLLARHKQSA